jgi:hypothetical protein
MRIHPPRLVTAALLVVGAIRLAAQNPPVASGGAHHLDADVALRAGTLGLGAEVGKLLLDHLAARAGVNFGSWSLTRTRSDITYRASLKLHGVSGLLDFFPHARGTFHLTGGIVSSPLRVSGVGQPSPGGTFSINKTHYTSADVGTLTAEAKYKSGPYAGLGFGTPSRTGGRVTVKFDLGAVLGRANVALDATGAATNAQLASDLAAQREKTQHDIDKFAKVYPVISLGLGLRF